MVIMKYNLESLEGNLLLVTSDTELNKFCQEVFSLGENQPEIYERIKHDQDIHAKRKKHLRKLDQQYWQDKNPNLPTIDCEQLQLPVADLDLTTGRPRMRAELVLLFLLLWLLWFGD